MPVLPILFLLVLSCEGFHVKDVPSGVIHYEQGVVITTFDHETHILTIELPNFALSLQSLMDTIDLDQEIKKAGRQHLRIVGDNLDRHLTTTLITWHQEISLKPMSAQDLQYYWHRVENGLSNRVERSLIVLGLGILLVGGVGAILSAINTKQISAINNVVSAHEERLNAVEGRLNGVEGRLAGHDLALKDVIAAINETSRTVSLNSENIKVLLKTVNIIEVRQKDLLRTMFLFQDIALSASIQLSDILDELEHLRSGKFPLKLLNPEVLQKFQSLVRRNDGLSYPLRLMESRVVGVDARGHTIRILVNVPVMKNVVFFPRERVINIGFPQDGCRKFMLTPKFLVQTISSTAPVNLEHCTVPSTEALHCDELALLSSSQCWPPSNLCGLATSCSNNDKPTIKSTPVGYLISANKMVVIQREGKTVKTLIGQKNYIINVDPSESIHVDGNRVSTMQETISKTQDDWDYSSVNITNWATNFTERITEMDNQVKAMNLSVQEFKEFKYEHFILGIDHSQALYVVFGVITGLISLLLLASLIWLLCFIKSKCRGQKTRDSSVKDDVGTGAQQIPLYTMYPTPTAPQLGPGPSKVVF